MYSYDDERSMLVRNTDFPANYAYGEVLGQEVYFVLNQLMVKG